jgi:hypothetical protein
MAPNAAIQVPLFGPPIDTQSSTRCAPPRFPVQQREERPPIEWVTVSTLLAPVGCRTLSR